MEDRFLYYEDDQGNRSDNRVHEDVMDDPDANTFFAFTLIQEALELGLSLEDAVSRYGDDFIRHLFATGKLTPALINEATAES